LVPVSVPVWARVGARGAAAEWAVVSVPVLALASVPVLAPVLVLVSVRASGQV
jgi:hypothetical protein